jgi:hypothetical protein
MKKNILLVNLRIFCILSGIPWRLRKVWFHLNTVSNHSLDYHLAEKVVKIVERTYVEWCSKNWLIKTDTNIKDSTWKDRGVGKLRGRKENLFYLLLEVVLVMMCIFRVFPPFKASMPIVVDGCLCKIVVGCPISKTRTDIYWIKY